MKDLFIVENLKNTNKYELRILRLSPLKNLVY